MSSGYIHLKGSWQKSQKTQCTTLQLKVTFLQILEWLNSMDKTLLLSIFTCPSVISSAEAKQSSIHVFFFGLGGGIWWYIYQTATIAARVRTSCLQNLCCKIFLLPSFSYFDTGVPVPPNHSVLSLHHCIVYCGAVK